MKTLHNYIKAALFSSLLCFAGGISKAQYCTINFSGGVEPITLVNFNTINNSTQSTGGTAYENFTGMSTTLLAGASQTITVKCNTFGNYVNWVRVFVDWNQNLVFTDPGESFDLGSITNSTGVDAIQVSGTITVPTGAVLGNTRMRVTAKWASYATSCNTAGYGQAEDYTLNILSSNSCTGTPSAGTATGPSAACPSVAFSLSLTGYTSSNGITFQWERNTGSGWQSITGATSPSYMVSSGIVSPESYRAVVTCTNGGASDISNIISVSVNPPTQCYCSISFPSGGEAISLVNFAGINNTSAATSTQQYEDYTATSGTVIQGQTTAITVKGYTGGAYTDSIMTYIDWDQNGSFTDPGESHIVGTLYNSTGVDAVQATSNLLVPSGALTGITRMRVTKKWNAAAGPCNSTGYGQAEDYTLNVLVANSCFGTPTAGAASAPASVCPNTSFTLDITGYTLAAGITIQWESSPASSANWQAISGATTASYTVTGGINNAMDYRAVVTCVNGGASDISNTISVAVAPTSQCYCTVNYPSGVEAITLVNVANINNASPDTSSIAQEDFTAVSTAVLPGSSYPITVKGNTLGNFTDYIRVYVDWNQNGLFTDAGEDLNLGTITNSTGLDAIQATGSLVVPALAPLGTTRMRVLKKWNVYALSCNNSGYGQAEDYSILVGTPLAIQLKEISAKNLGSRNQINWSTASEVKGDGFTLERSANGHDFYSVYTTSAKGEPSQYSWFDEAPLAGVNYYRLLLTDAAGTISYSRVVSANVKDVHSFSVQAFPNPVKDIIAINVSGKMGANAAISIMDATGKQVAERKLSANRADLNVSGLASGFYILRYVDDVNTQTIQIRKD
jgi:hypothetical protein